METAVREGLPKVSKKRIEAYLDDHVLVLQSRIYHDDQGAGFFWETGWVLPSAQSHDRHRPSNPNR